MSLLYATCARRPRNLTSSIAYVEPPSAPPPSTDPSPPIPTSTSDSDTPPPRRHLTLRLRRNPPSRDKDHDDAQSQSTPSSSSPSSASRHSSVATVAAPPATAVPSNPLISAASRARSSLTQFTHSNSIKYLIAGAIAGIVSRTAVSPLEVVATINMCTVGAAPPPLIHQLRRLFVTEGVRGFFKGNAANCLKVAPTKGIQFVAFEAFKRIIFRIHHCSPERTPKSLSALDRFVAGGMAGMIAATVCYPLDTAKTLLTAHPERFKSVLGTISSVTRTQGPGALYRGLSPTLVAMMPYAGLDFAIYEQLKLLYMRRTNSEANLATLLIIGAFAGAVAQTACHPLDVLRKRLQLQGINGRPILYNSMISAARGIVKTEGVGSLFRGLQPMYVSAIPSAGVSYVVYEYVKRMLGVRSFQ